MPWFSKVKNMRGKFSYYKLTNFINQNVQVYSTISDCFSRLSKLQFLLLPQDGTIALGHQSAFRTFDLAFGVLICCLLSRIIKCLQNSRFHPLKN